mmetsp:Transcript_7195/g.9640  ORF Transcript_7195/g.9640 Transcript_7195/m.9640 type:complete len:346 (+) Transcript_7195:189-1226(+)
MADIIDILGQQCTTHRDCMPVHEDILCLRGVCSCSPDYFNGLYGEICSDISNLTRFARITGIVSLLVVGASLINCWRMLRAYTLQKIFSKQLKRRELRLVPFTGKIRTKSLTYSRKYTQHKYDPFKFNPKDLCILLILLYDVLRLVCVCTRIEHLFQPNDPSTVKIRTFLLPLRFLVLNLSNIVLGIAWFEVSANIGAFRSLRYNLRKMKLAIHLICLFGIILALIFVLLRQRMIVLAVLEGFSCLVVIFLFTSSYFITRRTLCYQIKSNQMDIEQKAIANCGRRMAINMALMLITNGIQTMCEFKNGWVFNVAIMMKFFFTSSFELSMLIYLDTSRKVIRCIKR